MKYKGDFITNSSSTAFFFIFKGSRKKQLFDAINNHARTFKLEEKFESDDLSDYKCTVENVIEGINQAMKKNKSKFEWEICKIKPIKFLIEEMIQATNYYKKELADPKKKNEDWLIKIYKRELKDRLAQLKIIQEMPNTFTHYLKIEFGDSHGQATGSPAYACMDYKHPKLISDDLILLNENNH